MSGTKIGAAKARDANLAKDPDYYKNIGKKGGMVHSPGGFGTEKVDENGMTGHDRAKIMSQKAIEAKRLYKQNNTNAKDVR